MSIFNGRRVSPVSQDFIWVAEYADGSNIAEFDLLTRKENSFYSIQRDKLIRFGLIGHGMGLYYEVPGGIFKLNGRMIELIYKTKVREYYLTGHAKMYNDIITYKDAEAVLKLDGTTQSNITQFNFGYKQELEFEDGLKFNLRVLCKIPYNQPIYMNIRLVANKEVCGFLHIKRNGLVCDVFEAPLRKGVGGELNWVVR